MTLSSLTSAARGASKGSSSRHELHRSFTGPPRRQHGRTTPQRDTGTSGCGCPACLLGARDTALRTSEGRPSSPGSRADSPMMSQPARSALHRQVFPLPSCWLRRSPKRKRHGKQTLAKALQCPNEVPAAGGPRVGRRPPGVTPTRALHATRSDDSKGTKRPKNGHLSPFLHKKASFFFS